VNCFLTGQQLLQIAEDAIPIQGITVDMEPGYDIGQDLGWAARIFVPGYPTCYLMTIELVMASHELRDELQKSWISQVIEPLNEAYMMEHSG